MATKRDDYELNLRATDRASGEVDKLLDRIKDLTDADKTVILNAEAKKLENEVRRATVMLGKVDGEEAEAVLDARNAAQTKLDAVQGELDAIAGRTAEATLEADDNASDDVDRLDGKLDAVDGRTTRTTIDGDIGPNLEGALDKITEAAGGGGMGGIADALGGMKLSGGLVAGAVGGLLGVAAQATNTALEVGTIAEATGASLDEASRLRAVWVDAGYDTNDLLDILFQINGALEDSPEIAAQLGVKVEANQSPVETMVELIRGLNDSQLTAQERMVIMSKLFGEEGARQVAGLLNLVGDLDVALGEVDAGRIITPEELEAARQLRQQWADMSAEVQKMILDVGGPLIEKMVEFSDAVGGLGTFLFGPDLAGEFFTWEEGLNGAVTAAIALRDELVDEGVPAADAFNRALVANGLTIDETGTRIVELSDEALAGMIVATADAAVATADVTEAVDESTESIEEQIETLEDQRDALEDNVEALDEYRDAVRTAYDADIDLREAVQDKEDALARYNEVLADSESSEVDRREAGERVIATVLAEADAHVAAAQAVAKANGETLGATASINAMNGSLMMQARTIPRELLPAFAEMILDLNDISGEHRAEIKALIAEGDFDAAQRRLNEVSRTRSAAILTTVQQAQISQIDRSLDWISRDRTSVVNVAANVSNAISAIGRVTTALAVANALRNVLGRASGDENFQGGPVVVGEQGPELVDLPTGTRITPNHRIDERLADDAPTGNTYNITNNWPAGTPPRQVAAAQRRYERIRGPI